jgi:serine/threonine protein kinase
VVLYEMLTLKHPFDGRSMQELVLKITRGNYKPVAARYSTEIRGLITVMMARSQSKRPSVNGILKKPFVQARIAEFLEQTILDDEFSHTVIHGPRKHKVGQAPASEPSADAALAPVEECPRPVSAARKQPSSRVSAAAGRRGVGDLTPTILPRLGHSRVAYLCALLTCARCPRVRVAHVCALLTCAAALSQPPNGGA